VRVVVLADTHGPRRWRVCPPPVAAQLQTADLILHAGDVCTASVLTELAQYAPVVAVVGNNDQPDVAGWGATPTADLTLDGLRLAMLHDSGPTAGRLARMRRTFPGADLVVFGHSHIPLDERPAHLQPGLADRPQAAAARHDRRAADSRRPPARGQHHRGDLTERRPNREVT
jgi:putative phosphoesterase